MGNSSSTNQKNTGKTAYSLDKAKYTSMMLFTVLLFFIGYLFFILVYGFFFLTLRATDMNNAYLTQNVILRPIFQGLSKSRFFRENYGTLTIETFFKGILIFIYTILFVLLLKNLMRSHLYKALYGTIQFNPLNNPTNNLTMVTKIADKPTKDIIAYIISIIMGLIMIFAYPFIVLYLVRCYDVENNIATQLAIVSMLFVPIIYYVTSHVVTMKKKYKTMDILNYGKKYVEEKDYAYIDLVRKKFNFHYDTALIVPLILIFTLISYFFVTYEIDLTNTQVQIYLGLIFVVIPVILLVFNYNVLFSCYTDDNDSGIFRNGLIKYEVYKEGIKSYYDALVKYNYTCFPR